MQLPERKFVWLIWVVDDKGAQLRYIASDSDKAERTKNLLEGRAKQVFVEKSQVDHLFGERMESAIGRDLRENRDGAF